MASLPGHYLIDSIGLYPLFDISMLHLYVISRSKDNLYESIIQHLSLEQGGLLCVPPLAPLCTAEACHQQPRRWLHKPSHCDK